MSKPQEPSASTEGCPYAGLGHQFNLLSGPEYDELAAFFAQARREEPVFFSPVLNMWVISRYEAQVEILKDTDRFTVDGAMEVLNASVVPEARVLLDQSHVFTSLNMGFPDSHHARLRAPCAKFFSPQRIKVLEPRVREYAEPLVDGFAASGRADAIADFTYPLPLMVICDVLECPGMIWPWCGSGAPRSSASSFQSSPPSARWSASGRFWISAPPQDLWVHQRHSNSGLKRPSRGHAGLQRSGSSIPA